MNENVFFDRFSGLLTNTKERYDLNDIHDSLIVWFCENYLSLDPNEVKERIVKDSHAEGVDAVLIDEINYRLIFIQAKTVNNFENTKNNFQENDLKLTLEGFRFLAKGDYKGKITPELENLIDEYHELDKTGNYKTAIIFLTLKKPPIDKKFITYFRNEFRDVEVLFFDFDKLFDFYKKDYLTRKASPPENISFTVLNTVLEKDNPYKSNVFTTKAEELAKVYNDYKERIFQQNVRYSLGMRTRSINRLIFETAKNNSESPNFWYFNNGITIVCDQIKKTTSGKVINLRNAQIINGAQTTYALFEAYQNGDLKNNVEIIVKAIEASDKIFIENVTLFTNSQNAIRLRDLLSNLPIQINIQKILLDSYKYFYERKRGEFDSLYPTPEAKRKLLGNGFKDKLISNENAAQAFLALYLNRPAQAKSEKGRIFMKDTGFYDDIFNSKDEILAEKLLLAWKLLKYIEGQKKKYGTDYYRAVRLAEKRSEDLTDDEKFEIVKIYRSDFLFHSEYFISNLFIDFLKENKFDIAKDKQSVLTVISKIDNDDDVIKHLYEKIISELSEYIYKLREKPDYYHNKFFKSEKSIALVRNYFNQKYTFVEII